MFLLVRAVQGLPGLTHWLGMAPRTCYGLSGQCANEIRFIQCTELPLVLFQSRLLIERPYMDSMLRFVQKTQGRKPEVDF